MATVIDTTEAPIVIVRTVVVTPEGGAPAPPPPPMKRWNGTTWVTLYPQP